MKGTIGGMRAGTAFLFYGELAVPFSDVKDLLAQKQKQLKVEKEIRKKMEERSPQGFSAQRKAEDTGPITPLVMSDERHCAVKDEWVLLRKIVEKEIEGFKKECLGDIFNASQDVERCKYYTLMPTLLDCAPEM